MCGICGVSLSGREQVDVTALARQMLLGIEERGRHATGAAWDNGGETWLAKEAVPASVFVRGQHVPSHARTFIGHTRWATQGSPTNNDNNHPIDVRGIVGVHNGCISNDDLLFDLIGEDKRIAQVDSEAIFATLLHSGLDVTDSLEMLSGSAAVAWYDTAEPEVLHLARVNSSPLITATTSTGSLLFASTRKCIEQAAKTCGLSIVTVREEQEGTHLVIVDGTVEDMETFNVAERRFLTATERKALNLAW